ncbi:MAG: type II toxin-antitoxin system RelE/ParE family toxin [Gammaproteobacteria bacterium]|nr:type II toxin-antitoxin system RelE/ParE family toxin [Gammaproteobacteria bacterium]
MTWSVLQTRRFARQYKKLQRNIISEVDHAVEHISTAPTILGQRKNGDLADLYVYKFHANGQLYLLGYSCDESVRLIYLESVGSHENFYRDIKR